MCIRDRLIGERKGIIGLNMCQSFLNDSGKASVDDVITVSYTHLDVYKRQEEMICIVSLTESSDRLMRKWIYDEPYTCG